MEVVGSSVKTRAVDLTSSCFLKKENHSGTILTAESFSWRGCLHTEEGGSGQRYKIATDMFFRGREGAGQV